MWFRESLLERQCLTVFVLPVFKHKINSSVLLKLSNYLPCSCILFSIGQLFSFFSSVHGVSLHTLFSKSCNWGFRKNRPGCHLLIKISIYNTMLCFTFIFEPVITIEPKIKCKLLMRAWPPLRKDMSKKDRHKQTEKS